MQFCIWKLHWRLGQQNSRSTKRQSILPTFTHISVVKICLISQNTSVCICGILQFFLFQFDGASVPWSNPLFLLFFLPLLFISSFGAVTSMARDIAINRDWVVVLSKRGTVKLSGKYLRWPCVDQVEINAIMRRINLFCKFVSPLVLKIDSFPSF